MRNLVLLARRPPLRAHQLHDSGRGSLACVHPVRAEITRPGGARLSAVPQGMGAAAQRARRQGNRLGRLPHQGAARGDGRAHPPQTGGGQHTIRPIARTWMSFLARGGGLVVIHAGDRLARSGLVQGHRRRLVAERHDQVARRPDAARTSPIATARSPRTCPTGRWTTRSTTTWTFCPRPGFWRPPTRPSHSVRNAGCSETGRGAHRRRQAREHLRRAAADVDLRAHRGRRPHAVSRVRLDPGPPLREFQSTELPRDSAARHRLGRQARQRRRAPDEGRARRQPALRRRWTNRSSQGRREDRGTSGVRPDARRGRAADPQGHEHRLGRARPAVGLGNARVSQRPQTAEHRAVERQRIARGGSRSGIRRTRFPSSRTPTATASWIASTSSPTSWSSSPASCSTGRASSPRPRRTSGISRTRTATRSPTSARSSTPDSAPPTRTPSSTTFAGVSTAGSTPRTATASER